MPDLLIVDEFELDLRALYRRMWDIAHPDLQDGTRRYSPKPGGGEALKWLIAELAGTPVHPSRTMPANNRLRRLVHAALQEEGWAERLTQSSFRLLVDPDGTHGGPVGPASDPDDGGHAVEDIPVQALTSSAGSLQLGGLAWSEWCSLDRATVDAATTPGVYAARAEGHLIYIGMAGERRGQGIRGRLRVYASGAGAVSGLGEAALDRALADSDWLAERVREVHDGHPRRAKRWAAEALRRVPIEVCWSQANDVDHARTLERQLLDELEDSELWNRHRPRSP